MTIAMSVWAYILTGASPGLLTAGMRGTSTIYICVAVLYHSIVVSVAELASMVPLAGELYRWVSVLASPRYGQYSVTVVMMLTSAICSWRRPLSYISGWLLTLSWSCGVAAGMFILASMVRIAASIGDESAVIKPWQVYITFICTSLNTVGHADTVLLLLRQGHHDC